MLRLSVHRALMLTTTLLTLLGGCSGPPECDVGFVGTPGAAPEMEIVHRTADGMLVPAVEGGPVDLFDPPQGGQVFLTAARIRNVDGCGLRVEAAFRDECTGRVLGLDGRPYQVRETEDGWLEPRSATALSSWANVPACPTAAAERAVTGEPYTLVVTVIDAEGQRITRSMPVVPTCVASSERCACECSEGYALGDRCDGDAGPPRTTADAGCPDRG